MKNKEGNTIFYAVVPNWGDAIPNHMSVMLLGGTKKMAIRLYEYWNDDKKVNLKEEDLVVRRFIIENHTH